MQRHADVVNDGGVAGIARVVRMPRRILRVEQDDRHLMRAGSRDALGDAGAKAGFVNFRQRVVGADLPDHQFRPACIERRLETRKRRLGDFAADPRIADIRIDARPGAQSRAESGGVGAIRRRRADALGRGRTDGENVQRIVRRRGVQSEFRAVVGIGGGLDRANRFCRAGVQAPRVGAKGPEKRQRGASATVSVGFGLALQSSLRARKNKNPMHASV